MVNMRGGEGAVALAVGAGEDKEGHLNMATNMHECIDFGRVQSGLFTLMLGINSTETRAAVLLYSHTLKRAQSTLTTFHSCHIHLPCLTTD